MKIKRIVMILQWTLNLINMGKIQISMMNKVNKAIKKDNQTKNTNKMKKILNITKSQNSSTSLKTHLDLIYATRKKRRMSNKLMTTSSINLLTSATMTMSATAKTMTQQPNRHLMSNKMMLVIFNSPKRKGKKTINKWIMRNYNYLSPTICIHLLII